MVIAMSAGGWCSFFDFAFMCQRLGILRRVIIIPSFLLLKFAGECLGYFCVVFHVLFHSFFATYFCNGIFGHRRGLEDGCDC